MLQVEPSDTWKLMKVSKESKHSVLGKRKNQHGPPSQTKKCGLKRSRKVSIRERSWNASDTYSKKVCASTDRIQKIGSNRSLRCFNSCALLEIKAVAIDLPQHSVEKSSRNSKPPSYILMVKTIPILLNAMTQMNDVHYEYDGRHYDSDDFAFE